MNAILLLDPIVFNNLLTSEENHPRGSAFLLVCLYIWFNRRDMS
jgi:hypothetical protein